MTGRTTFATPLPAQQRRLALGGGQGAVLAAQNQPVREHPVPAFRYDRLGVELDAPQGQVHMLKPHDHSVPGSGRDFQLAPHGSGLDRQGVVAGDPQRRGQAVEHADAGVLDEGRLSVPKLRGVRNRRPESFAESLVLLFAVVAGLFLWVFPWVANTFPAFDNTVG